jgi:Protein of unknown function (DUF1587)
MVFTTWLGTCVSGAGIGMAHNPDPGRVTIRRLNRAEYNNTVRDLLGIDFHPADDFPNDDMGYGFDNIGDVLALSPLLLEKYVTAAEQIMETVLTNEVLKGRLFTMSPVGGNTNACLEQIIGGFARRAFRRPTTAAEIGRLVRFANDPPPKHRSQGILREQDQRRLRRPAQRPI